MAEHVQSSLSADYVMRRAPKLGAGAQQLQQLMQAPYELGLASLLGAASAACQGLFDVVLPYGSQCPASLAILTVASSGERKTAVMKKAMEALNKADKKFGEMYECRLVEYRAAYAAWSSKRKSIEKSIRANQRTGESCDTLVWCLEEHLKQEPESPRPFRLLHKDVSPLAMLATMKEVGIGALFSSEGAEVLDGKAFEAIPHLNSAWSGDNVSVVRVGKPDITITDPRLTICLMVQPGVLDNQRGKKGRMLRDSGHWARYLVFSPPSTQGTRFASTAAISTDHLEAFNQRLSDLLDLVALAVENRQLQRTPIRLSNAAADEWVVIADQIESNIAPGRVYERAADHASKIAENIARLAGVIHSFEGFDGDISLDTVQLAAEICRLASDSYMAVFVPPPEEYRDADLLWDQLYKYALKGWRYVEKTFARQRCHNSMRKNGRFDKALDVLVDRGLVRYWVDDRRKGYIVLDPGFMPNVMSRFPSPVMTAPPTQGQHHYPVFKPVDPQQ